MYKKTGFHYIAGIMSLTICLLLTQGCKNSKESYWSASDGKIIRDGRPEYFIGTNLWYAGRLCATPEGRARLETELQTLKGIGVNNLRVLAVEGEDLDNLAYGAQAFLRPLARRTFGKGFRGMGGKRKSEDVVNEQTV